MKIWEISSVRSRENFSGKNNRLRLIGEEDILGCEQAVMSIPT